MKLLLPPPPAMVPKMSSASPALLPLPPLTTQPKSIAQFFWTLLAYKADLPGSTLQAISTAGTPAVQIAGTTVPWPSSAPLWPATIAAVIAPAAGVRKQCHHPGKPVQAGGVVGQVNSAHARQVRQGAPCNGATATVAAVIWQRGQHPLQARQQQPHYVGWRKLSAGR
jgi:hypothetical protein